MTMRSATFRVFAILQLCASLIQIAPYKIPMYDPIYSSSEQKRTNSALDPYKLKYIFWTILYVQNLYYFCNLCIYNQNSILILKTILCSKLYFVSFGSGNSLHTTNQCSKLPKTTQSNDYKYKNAKGNNRKKSAIRLGRNTSM